MGYETKKEISVDSRRLTAAVFVSRQAIGVYTVTRKGCDCRVRKKRGADIGDLCCGTGSWDPDIGYFSGRCAVVSGVISIDCLRLCLLQILRKESMYANRCLEIAKGSGRTSAKDI